MGKRILLTSLITLFALINLGNFTEEGPFAAVTYYLSQYKSTSTKLFTLSGTGDADTTAFFETMRYMTFFANAQQAGDSVHYTMQIKLYPRNRSDSTHYAVLYDSAFVHGSGVKILKWRNFEPGTDSTCLKVPPGYYAAGVLYTTTSGNGKLTSIHIRYEGRKEGEF
jgi:hypothetical protein